MILYFFNQTIILKFQSLATALHVLNGPITGQTGPKQSLDKNPGVFINPEQPLVAVIYFSFFLLLPDALMHVKFLNNNISKKL